MIGKFTIEYLRTGADSGPREHSGPSVRVGALVPLTSPGWVEAGQHLLAGLHLGVQAVNSSGGVLGRPLELVVRDTCADPQRAVAEVDEFDCLGVAAVVGEYHSVVARAVAAKADELAMPFLCSSAVFDALTDQPTDAVARLAPAQSHGWRIYADFLLSSGYRHIALAMQSSIYWAAGATLLRDYLLPRGGTVTVLDMGVLNPESLCAELADSRAEVLLLLVGNPEPTVSIVKAVRRDDRLAKVVLGAPAGQPEFPAWSKALGHDGAGIPFLRYLPERLSPLGKSVDAALRYRLAVAPSFVAFEGYDTAVVLAHMLGTHGFDRARLAGAWPNVVVEGSRGEIRFSRTPGITVWQWVWPPVQVVDRDPDDPDRLRLLHASSS